MPEKPDNQSSFWQELKRRKVVRVITVYAAAAFVILELVDIVSPALGLPSWTLSFVIVLLCIGFIISVILSWVFDITPDGIQKTKPIKEVKASESQPNSNYWKIISYVSIAIVISLVFLNIFYDRNKGEDLSELERSIAVLPFDNMSLGEKYSHMGDAITDEIILELQKIHEFDRVLSRTSTMQYKNNRPTIPEIASKLEVNYVIEGSIQRHNDEVNIRVQVIRAKQEDHIWADKFEGKWKDIFSLQDEIAFKVAQELKTTLSPVEVKQIEETPTQDTEAYNLYLRGRYFWNQRTEEGLLKAINYFNQAVQIDNNYALAHIGLADSYSMLGLYTIPPNPTYLIQAEKAALEALKIDNSLAEAHTSIGWVYFNVWKMREAEEEFINAIKLNPRYATAHHWYSMLLLCQGRYDQAIEEILIAQDLEPLSLVIGRNVGYAYLCVRQYDKAIIALNKIAEIDPDFPDLQLYLAQAYLNKGMFEEAQSAIRKSSERYKPWKGIIYAEMGYLDEANQILQEVISSSEVEKFTTNFIALLYFVLGYEEEGFSYLEKAYEEHIIYLTWINTYPEMDPFR
ncbi:MAG: tetratricopeptide repeat protein, partial [Bacteroidota bacterium]